MRNEGVSDERSGGGPGSAPGGAAGFAADCRARLAFEVIANRWDNVVLYVLGEGGPMRPRTLLDRIGGLSPKVLNETLRRLEYNGLVERHRYAEAPPRVDYALTDAGTALLDPIRALGAWAETHADSVLAAQERYENNSS
ncbi:helix-turn-helix domain-containing protein [Kitasatospora sp. NPDC028055]|uniref:winged helix-turn-helix transcriptional regulator n=1 Tax=Kitasatospora sp. NPDC028055 TaxID=3155653 RepID=UPI0033C3AF34